MANYVALFGGTFNPPHIGHMLVAQEAYFKLGVRQVTFIPAAQNPLKPSEQVFATDLQRLAMVRLAVGDDKRFTVDSEEIETGGVSYTITTLQRYKAAYADELYFLVGADAAIDLARWKNIEQYSGLCTLAIYNRPGFPDFSNGLPKELENLNLRWQYLSVPQVEISSSEIRRRIATGAPFDYMMPSVVAKYIRECKIGK